MGTKDTFFLESAAYRMERFLESTKKLEKTRALAQERYAPDVRARVRFCLVTEFAQTLGAFH